VGERVPAVAGVVDAVARTKEVLHAVERQAQGAALHREVLARARGVRVELTGIDPTGDGRAHELELHTRQHGRQDPPLPARRVVRGIVLAAPQHHHTRRALVAEQPGDAGVEPGGDAIQHQDGRHLAPPLHFREHAPAHARAGFQILQREVAAKPLEAKAGAEPGHVEPRGQPRRALRSSRISRIRHSEHNTLWWNRPPAAADKKAGGAISLPPLGLQTARRAPRGGYSPEVPTQPVSETSTVTPSGPVYFTSTLPYRLPCCPTPRALLMSSRGSDPAFCSRSVIASRLSTWKPMWWMPLQPAPRSTPATASFLK